MDIADFRHSCKFSIGAQTENSFTSGGVQCYAMTGKKFELPTQRQKDVEKVYNYVNSETFNLSLT